MNTYSENIKLMQVITDKTKSARVLWKDKKKKQKKTTEQYTAPDFHLHLQIKFQQSIFNALHINCSLAMELNRHNFFLAH